MDLLDKYIKELGEDTSLDEFTVRDVQMKLPGIKHKWAGRLMRLKLDNEKLKADRGRHINSLADQLIKESHVKLSKPIARQTVEQHESIIEMNRTIKDNTVAIEFLEKAERILNSMTFDIKNLTEIMKLETQ